MNFQGKSNLNRGRRVVGKFESLEGRQLMAADMVEIADLSCQANVSAEVSIDDEERRETRTGRDNHVQHEAAHLTQKRESGLGFVGSDLEQNLPQGPSPDHRSAPANHNSTRSNKVPIGIHDITDDDDDDDGYDVIAHPAKNPGSAGANSSADQAIIRRVARGQLQGEKLLKAVANLRHINNGR